ncbi:MAG: 50S ribosomal protein L29 [Planctomycetota bacterium]
MKIEEIRTKSDTELDFDMGNMKKELFDLRFKSATSGVKSTAQIRNLRRSIARIHTVLAERAQGIRGQEVKE